MKPLVRDILKATAQHFDMPVQTLCDRSSKRKYAWPRQVAMFLSHEMGGISLPEVARRIGSFDHTTVLHACRAVGRASEGAEVLATVMAIAAQATAITRARLEWERERAREFHAKKAVSSAVFKVVAGKLIITPAMVDRAVARRILLKPGRYNRDSPRPLALPSALTPPDKKRLMGARA